MRPAPPLPRYPHDNGTLPDKHIYIGAEALTALTAMRIPLRMLEASIDAGERFANARMPQHSLKRSLGFGRLDARIAEMSFEADQTNGLWLTHNGNITYRNGWPIYYPTVSRFDRRIALTCCEGNEFTGNPNHTPDRLSSMGNQAKALIDANRHVEKLLGYQACLGEINDEWTIPNLHTTTYILLVHGAGDSVRMEISLPIRYNRYKGEITGWRHRILITRSQLGGQHIESETPLVPDEKPTVIYRPTGRAV